MSDSSYIGRELELFEAARNWKAYVGSRIDAYLGNAVLEIGAGFGGTTRALCRGDHTRWVCVEPDARLAERLRTSIHEHALPACCDVIVGTLEQVDPADRFDSIVYIDVLEHILDDRAELVRAAQLLRPGGYIIGLSPAHQWLYTAFDEAIGHYRRYTTSTLAAITPPTLEIVRLMYLDSVGMLASMGNRFFLNQSMPNARQIAVWDGWLVPMSRIVDPLLVYSLGKSVLGVWQKPPSVAPDPTRFSARAAATREERHL